MKKIFIASALSALLLAGCTTPPPAAEPEPIQLEVAPCPGVTVTFADENVARGVAVMTARIAKQGTLPQLALTFKNISQIKFPIEYRVEWLDENGAPLMTSSAWQRITLTGSAMKSVSSIGKAQNAQTANVSVRFPIDVEIFVPEPDPVELMQVQQQMQQMQQNQ